MDEYLDNYSFWKGYNQALDEINQPRLVIQEKWCSSVCPRCGRDFSEFEPCNDGYYERCVSLERCPYCGQSIEWY